MAAIALAETNARGIVTTGAATGRAPVLSRKGLTLLRRQCLWPAAKIREKYAKLAI